MKLKRFLTILIVISLFLYATNPTKADFIEYSKSKMRDSIVSSGVTSNSFINQIIGAIAGSVSSSVAEVIYTRNDYVIFSIYEVTSIDFEYRCIGIANQFFLLKDTLVADTINTLFSDITNIFSKNRTLQEDEYAYYEFNISRNRDVEFRINSVTGPDFEMLVFDKSNFNKYLKVINGQSAEGIKVFGQYEVLENGSKKETINLRSGTYVVLVDNTDNGSVIPPMNFINDSVTYKLEIDLK